MRRHSRILTFFLAAVAVAATATAADGPKAVPVEPIKDFEVVTKGDTIVHEFQIRNDGKAVLELTDVKPACGCTVADFDRKIAPGKTGKIRAKLDTTDFTGPISKSVAVFTNDPANPKIQLVLKAKVVPYISVTPGYARFNYVQQEPIVPITQTIWTEDGTDVKILDVKAPKDFVTVSFREAKDEERNPKGKGRQWLVDIALDPETSPVGALRDYVEIRLDHPKQKTVKLPISGFVRPRQHITPEKVDFGKIESAALPYKQTLTFTNFATETIEVTKIETGNGAISAEVRDSDRNPGHRFLLDVTLGPDMPKGDFEGTVKIRTTDKKHPVIELPLRGEVL